MQKVENDSSRIIDGKSWEEIIEAAGKQTYIDKWREYAEKEGWENHGRRYDKAIL